MNAGPRAKNAAAHAAAGIDWSQMGQFDVKVKAGWHASRVVNDD
jgi:hypothetical protein